MKAPFVYFGGKSTVAHIVWQALGQPKQYIEPFFGSGAVLLLRENYDPTKYYEIVNDKDGYISNVWRALQQAPDEVAKWCDYPINHADLSARKMRLIEKEGYLLENLIKDDMWFDPKLAGYWIWAASCWIGSGLTRIGQIPRLTGNNGVHRIGQIPQLTRNNGVHHIGQIPQLTRNNGVHQIGQIPHLTGSSGMQEPYNENIYKWFRELSERLRYVKVVCGDWTRVCGGDWQDNNGIVGMFFDPPYGVTDRAVNIYHQDSVNIAKDVMEWVKERGKKETYRIVIAGYEEYQELLSIGWTEHKWKAMGGYGNLNKGDKGGKKNRFRENLYMSPHCIKNTLF